MTSDTVLLITSAQRDLLAPGGKAWPLVEASVLENRIPQRLAQLIDAARSARVPVIHSPVAIDHDALDGFRGLCAIQKLMLQERLVATGTPGSDWIAEARPKEGDVVLPPRRGFSSFWAGTLAPRLEELGARTIYIAGMLAEACVTSHARDAVENGYRPIVVSDAIGSTSLELLAASRLELGLHAHALKTTEQAVACFRKAAA
jgi:nicotinamidase-related amidase